MNFKLMFLFCLFMGFGSWSEESPESEDPQFQLARLNAERRNLMSKIDDLRRRVHYIQNNENYRALQVQESHERRSRRFDSSFERSKIIANRRIEDEVTEINDSISKYRDEIMSLEVQIGRTQAEATRLGNQARAENNNRDLLTQILSLRVDLSEMQTELLSLKNDLLSAQSYTQAKIIQLLQSDTLCSAVKSCRRNKNKLTAYEITRALFTETDSQSTPERNPETPAERSQGDR